ncbi:MAG: DEAD/DEAH box helicase [Flavobacteriaceae bacterium]|nr:DEAD/DEAH box helicase [Flavobacteriaceae bacterium]
MSIKHSKPTDIELYEYQKRDIERIFECFDETPDNYNLLYQLPTGGGKTVIFSEIARKYIIETGKKVLVLTHRIELCGQTSAVLEEFGIPNKVIDSDVKELHDQQQYQCFVAMVETLNNRLQDEKLRLQDIGLVIVDEAHYNSFRKLFSYFKHCRILGVTATPLSSNIKLPMKDCYEQLIVGESIASLVDKQFLAKANYYSYNVSLQSLKVGINGDYTVKSSEALYNNTAMQEKLLTAYEERAKGKKTLIFNNGINTSRFVHHTFAKAGYEIKHLDNTTPSKERKDILKWFRKTPNAILTSVSILTTGFDEPSVEAIILNRATKSLTLYFQMLGRGSRVIKEKKEFEVIDLGNNVARFGLWDAPRNWQEIFRYPNYFLENIAKDEDIERTFTYEMPESLRQEFPNSESVDFDIETAYKEAIALGKKSKYALEQAVLFYVERLYENCEDVFDARILAQKLGPAIEDVVKRYTYLIMNNTNNYKDYLIEDFKRKLRVALSQKYAGILQD